MKKTICHSYTDHDLGSQHARLGLEARYPNNQNYMRGLVAEMKSLLTRGQLAVYANVFPGGINELNIDDALKLCERTLDKAVAKEAIKTAEMQASPSQGRQTKDQS